MKNVSTILVQEGSEKTQQTRVAKWKKLFIKRIYAQKGIKERVLTH